MLKKDEHGNFVPAVVTDTPAMIMAAIRYLHEVITGGIVKFEPHELDNINDVVLIAMGDITNIAVEVGNDPERDARPISYWYVYEPRDMMWIKYRYNMRPYPVDRMRYDYLYTKGIFSVVAYEERNLNVRSDWSGFWIPCQELDQVPWATLASYLLDKLSEFDSKVADGLYNDLYPHD